MLKLTRDFYIPKTGAVKVASKTCDAIVYAYDRGDGVPRAMGFSGRTIKPTFHYRFSDLARRERYITEFFRGLTERAQRKADQRAAKKAFRHSVQVGDIFYTCWGYEQTNVEYFQVVELRGKKQILVREIAKHYHTTAFMSGNSAPEPDSFCEDSRALGKGNPAKVCTVRGSDQENVSIKISSYRTAWPLPHKQIGGLKVYETRYESHYA